MRATMQTTYRQVLSNLNQLTTDIQDLNRSISSTQQMSKLSDSPVHLVTALSLRSSLAEIKQYQENLVFGDNMIRGAESALTQIKELAMRAKVLTLQDINASVVQTGRFNTAEEVHNLFEQAVTLANTQINGKYIFGGYRTSGYTETEPAPFIIDQVDGHLINGNTLTTMNTMLTGTVTGVAIAAGDLAINGNATALAITNGAGDINGLSMRKADSAKAAINAADPAHVTTTLTTLYAGAASTGDTADATDSVITFDLNGVPVSVTIPDGSNAATAAGLIVTAINSVSDQTGVDAVVGDGTNGGVADSVVFRNILAGDESNIEVTNYDGLLSTVNPGFGNFSQAADDTHNRGTISIQSDETFVLTSPTAADDSVLAELGLGGGSKGFLDEAGDGELIYGYRLTATDLTINGYGIGSASADPYSDVYKDTSAEAKGTAINAVLSTTGVTAVVIPAYRQASGPVEAGTLDAGDLVINGIDIFTSPTAILDQDADNTLMDAINAQTALTGFTATRYSTGTLLLSAQDGRNLHIRTSAEGERVTRLNYYSATAYPQDQVYFGSVQLRSERTFMLETTPTPVVNYEPGLAAIGLAGGSLYTGEADDIAGDGQLSVKSIAAREGDVRYAGDRINDIDIKVGKTNTLTVARNGKETIADIGVFTVLKTLEDNLRNLNHTTVTGIHQATDTTATLDSGATGLANEDLLENGTFTVTVTDHDVFPARDFSVDITVDTSVDTLESIAAKIDGIPGVDSWWDSDGYMHIESIDPDRYTFSLSEHYSNFLSVAGVTSGDMQIEALDQSLVDLDQLMDDLTGRIADFGALSNRIEVQKQIYDNLELSTSENLSEQQDTDLVEALMTLRNKEVAYEAALSATARTLQISLVDFL